MTDPRTPTFPDRPANAGFFIGSSNLHTIENAGRQPGADIAYNTDGTDGNPPHGVVQYTRAVIVSLALWGGMSYNLATRLILRGSV